jgi:fructose-1,6-bisphosphatase/sedoheptulose 1,7-bisphosphatase-like protein
VSNAATAVAAFAWVAAPTAVRATKAAVENIRFMFSPLKIRIQILS